MEHRSRHSVTGSVQSGVFFGLLFIVAGTVLLLERFGYLQFNLLSHFWPAFWLVAGFSLLFSHRGTGGAIVGLGLISVAVVLELQRFGVLRIRLRELWPIYIIGIGVFLLIRALRPPRSESTRLVTTSRLAEFMVMGGGEFRYASDSFEGGNITAVMGGAEGDLTRARILQSPAVLYVDAILGGVELRVPPEWNVVYQGIAIMGGFDNRTLPSPAMADGQPRQELIVKGLSFMGGVGVKN